MNITQPVVAGSIPATCSMLSFNVVGYALVKPRILEQGGCRFAIFDSPGDDDMHIPVVLDSPLRRSLGEPPSRIPRARRMAVCRLASNAQGQPAATEPAQQAGRGPLGCADLLGADHQPEGRS